MVDGTPKPSTGADAEWAMTEGSARRPHPRSLQSQSSATRVPKIAIPRIRRGSETESNQGSTRSDNKHRVSHACEPCRHRKTKCSGERPICKHCEEHRIRCYYADGKRDRAKKEVVGMAEKLDIYESLLRQLAPQLDPDLQNTVNQALVKSPSPAPGDFISPTQSPRTGKLRQELDIKDGELDGEHLVSGRAGSTGSLDRVYEDLNRDATSRAHGFMGKQSDVAWLQRVEKQLEEGSSSSGIRPDDLGSKYGGGGGGGDYPRRARENPFKHTIQQTTKEATYHLDDLEISIPEIVDEFALPTKDTADALLNVYLTTVHSAFPVLLKSVFVNQYANYFATFDPRFGRRWLTMLNLIFAIGAKYSHLAQAPWRGDPRDHLIYLARARRLDLEQGMFSGHGDFEQVQVLTLFTFYLLACDQINRAWITAGHAIRIAQSLGLHLLNLSKELTDVQKEVAVRAWWSIYSLERLLCVMCGRPSAVSDREISNSLPILMDEDAFPQDGRPIYDSRERFQPHRSYSDQSSNTGDESRRGSASRSSLPDSTTSSTSNSRVSVSSSRSRSPHDTSLKHPLMKIATMASYFVARTHLTILTHTILEQLYCAKVVDHTWAHVQKIFSDIDNKLKAWRTSLPVLFDFTKAQRDQTFYRQRLALGFLYYSAQLLLKRPYLCRVDRHIPNESARSKHFNRNTAIECVQAARNMVDLIPDDPNPAGLYSVAPWWSLLHNLMQAGAILMLEMSYRADHAPNQAADILVSAKKVTRWVWSMSEDDAAARRAWRTMLPLLKKAAAKIGGDTSDVSELEPALPLPPNSQADTNVSGSFESSLPSGLDVFELTQAMYPSSMATGSVDQPPMLWTDYDDLNPMSPAYGGQSQGHVSAMFPTSSQMESMGDDQEMADYDYPSRTN